MGGTGPAGLGLALRWARAGETIIIGSRNAERAQEAAAKIKERARCASQTLPDRKIPWPARLPICWRLTVPFEGQAALLKQLKPSFRPGSVLIDVTVPLASSVGGRASRTLGVWQGSAAQQTAELVPKGVTVVAAFQNCSADVMYGDDPVECDVIVCSDDSQRDSARKRTGGQDSGTASNRRR